MDWYVYIAWTLIVSQLLFMLLTIKNYQFALTKYRQKRDSYTPRAAVIVPCKNLDTNFEQNISSFYKQDYGNYLLWFVVEDSSDPAYEALCKLKEKIGSNTNARDVRRAGFRAWTDVQPENP